MKIRILMITHNRPSYTELSLKTLCERTPETAKIVIWDNASESSTKTLLRKYEMHPRIDRILYNPKNEKLRGPTNWFFENYGDADLLGKVDDDCLVPTGWCETLQQAHVDIPDAGILACWHFLPEDFNEVIASKKIFQYGKHRIMRNCWVGGSGYLLKQAIIQKVGFIREGETFTTFCIRVAAKGYINGWYYPFLFQEHMDDPRAEHTGIKTEHDFRKMIPLTATSFNVDSRDGWIRWQINDAQKLQAYSIDPYDFIGLRSKIKRNIFKVFGKEYFPLFK